MQVPLTPLQNTIVKTYDTVSYAEPDGNIFNLKIGLNTIELSFLAGMQDCTVNLIVESGVSIASIEKKMVFDGILPENVFPQTALPLLYSISKVINPLSHSPINITNNICPTITRPLELSDIIIEKYEYDLRPVLCDQDETTGYIDSYFWPVGFDQAAYPTVYYTIWCE